MNIQDFKQQNPAYAEVPDAKLALQLHRKFYSDRPIKKYLKDVGVDPVDTQIEAGRDEKLWDYWTEQVSKPQKGETEKDTKDRLIGKNMQSAPDSYVEGVARSFLQGNTFGFGDEVVSTVAAAAEPLLPGKSQGTFKERRDFYLAREREKNAAFQESNPGSAIAAELGGAVSSGVGLAKAGLLASAKLAPKASLGTRMLAGSIDGAVGGTLYGAGTGEDLKSRAKKAALGGAIGATFGGTLPALGAGLKNTITPALNAWSARSNPVAFQSKKILERFEADGVPLGQAQRRMKDGLNLADVGGESGRNLLRTATNLPGKAQKRVASQLALRQMQQGDRLKAAVRDTFADPDGYLAAKEKIGTKAQEMAKPLYDEAYANPVPFSRALEDILSTPAGKDALRKAVAIAGNEQKPFAQLFANVADDGTVAIKRVPDMRAWDYIKRGFDDVIEGQMDSITGKVTNAGRAVVGLKNRMLKELDDANPAYAEARKLWSGFAKLDEALEYGKGAFKKSPEEVRRAFAGMSEAEKQAARMGYAEVLRKRIDDAGFTHNAIQKIIGDRGKYGRLQAMFASKKDLNAFRRTMIAEAKKQKTFNAARGNSTTVRQLMDMYESGGLKSDAVGAATEIATGRIDAFVQRLGGWLSRIGGMTPEVADGISQKLLATNPQVVSRLFRDLNKLETKQIAGEKKAAMIRDAVTRVVTIQALPQIAN